MSQNSDVIQVGTISGRILLIRGVRVIVDADLAEFYGVSTKRLNEQVKRNRDRFVDEGRGGKADAFALINSPKYQTDSSPAPFRLPANPSPVYRIDGQIRPAPAPVPVAR